jgi:hypothetical protein
VGDLAAHACREVVTVSDSISIAITGDRIILDGDLVNR